MFELKITEIFEDDGYAAASWIWFNRK